MCIYFWEIHFYICSSWKDRNKYESKLHSKTTLLTWESSSAEIEADCWNAHLKLPGLWKCVVWMVLQQPSKSPRPSEVVFGCGKGSDVMAPIPTDLCGARGHRASPWAQPGCGVAAGGVQSAPVGQAAVSVPPEMCSAVPRCRDCPLPAGLSLGELVSLLPACPTQCSHRALDVLLSHLCTLGALLPSPGLHHYSAWHCLSKTLMGKVSGKIWRKSQPADWEGVGVGCCSYWV